MLAKRIKAKLSSLQHVKNEEKALLKFLNSLKISSEQIVLDVGCGYGDKIRLLQSIDINVEGVEINPKIVEHNKREGLNCISVDDFKSANKQYDVLLMSHVIEHFLPEDLLFFMDSYLDSLKTGGFLIILTPLMSPAFYMDFDHVKPYHPTGISMVFSGTEAQVQYYSRNKLELIDIWFRRTPFRFDYSPGFYLKKYSRFPVLINIIFALIFRLSFGLVGITNGWIGVYRKIS